MKYIFRSILAFLLFSNQIAAQNEDISTSSYFDGEPFIAINPANNQNIVVAWMGYVFNYGTGQTIRVRSSFDGGRSWSSAINMPHVWMGYESADVSMAFAQNGTLYLTYMEFSYAPDSGAVYFCKSLDGGLSWSIP
ncbi:MAG: T9SS type A sorting domain-containing protein, partial [Bacteroidia bacterium]